MLGSLFWIVSRTAVTFYRHFPIFGALRGAIAIIRREDRFVVVRRNDGYGMCFPGGLARPWEVNEQTLRREVHEETGLQVEEANFKFCFHTSLVYPTLTNVFEATASGSLTDSWEGSVSLASLEELDRHIMPTQRAVVDYLKTGRLPV
jgi:8-oxo-dGTP pyrophosphatase MutT (NUDIX family)